MKPSGCNIIHISDSGPYMGQTNEMVHRKSINCPWVQNFLAKVCLRVHCATMQIDLVTTLTLNKICSASLSNFRQLSMIYWYWIVQGFNVKGLNIWRLYSAVWHFDPENAQKLRFCQKGLNCCDQPRKVKKSQQSCFATTGSLLNCVSTPDGRMTISGHDEALDIEYW